MKTALMAILLSVSLLTYSADNIGPLVMYDILSDKKDESVKEGNFIIEGTVLMFSSNLPVDGAIVNAYKPNDPDRETAEDMLTDSLGKFSMTLPVGTEQFCAMKLGFSECCISDYEFKDQHRIKVKVYLYQAQNQIKRKPIIYMYSDEPLSASVKLNPYGDFTFTYPKYENGWEIEIDNDNQLKIKGEDRTYPYLFWEAESHGLMLKNTGLNLPGFFMKTDTATQFLEKTLDVLGLNQTEKTDFITYWGPVLEREDYAFVQFLIDEECEERVAALSIEPKPESMRRIYMILAPYESNAVTYNIIPQEFSGFDRKGFTVLEWGGGEIDLEYLKP